MRRYHRWLSAVFGVLILWIAVTGVMSQFAALTANGGFEKETAERGRKEMAAAGAALVAPAAAHENEVAPAVLPPHFVCPADMTCRAKAPQSGARAWVGYLHHLHSGEEFGPAGVVLSILSGLALVFFAFSGLWMYIRMWSHRRSNGHKPAWFWK